MNFLNPTDIIVLIPVFVLVSVLFYLSHKEIKKSLGESKNAQELLLRDRDILTSKLEERTRELEEVRMRRLSELAKAAEFGRMAQGLFHDLMTPLTSIILHAEKLKEVQGAHKSIERAVEASKRMATYVKDMRATLSREEAERECFLKEELTSILNLLRYPAQNAGVEIVLKQIEDCAWFGSPTKIRQVFSNLISNAIDSFDDVEDSREKTVIIELYKNETRNIFTVEDNGCGISIENQPQIFEPFFTTKSRDKGTGLGLATVKRIVDKNLNGTIELKSTEGRGTLFKISFPPSSIDPAASLPPQHRAPDLV